MRIRTEHSGDAAAIRRVIELAFAEVVHSAKTEGAIVDALRTHEALSLSLVAEVGTDEMTIVGHAAFSPLKINGTDRGWYGLGPVSVHPDHQGHGIGLALIKHGIDELKAIGAKGCAALGDPAYYRHAGFAPDSRLKLEGVPPEYFQCLPFGAEVPEGIATYHPSFGGR